MRRVDGVQVGHQHAYFAGGGDMAYKAHGLWRSGAFEIGGVTALWRGGEGGRGELGARAEERALGDMAQQTGLLFDVPKELVKFGLCALAHTAEKDRHQGRQGQFALAREGLGMIGMAGLFEEIGGVEVG